MKERLLICILLFSCNLYYSRIFAIGVCSPDDKSLINKIVNSIGEESAEQKLKDKADQYLQLGTLYTENGLYTESVDYFLKADSIFVSTKDYENHAYALTRLYHSYHVVGQKMQYDVIREQLLSINENVTFNNPNISLIVESQIGKFYVEDGDYEKAFKAYNNSLTLNKKYYGEYDLVLFPIYYELTSLCLKIGNLINASEYMEHLKAICESHPVSLHDRAAYILLKSQHLNQSGNVGQAVALLEDNQNIFSKIENPELKTSYYNTLSGLYDVLGNYKESLKIIKLSLTLCEESAGAESVQYVHLLLNLGESYALCGNDSNALQSTLKATDIIRTKYGTDHPEYYQCLSKLVARYRSLNDDKSKKLRKECLILSEKIFGRLSTEYADNLMLSVELSANPSEDDLEKFRRGLEIRRNLGRDFDEFYLSYLYQYGVLLFMRQDWKSLMVTSNEILKCTKEFIRINFQKLGASQREMLWKTVKQAADGLEDYAANYSRYAVEHNDYSFIDDFGKIAYDTRLLKKGLLLESNKILTNLINSSSDSSVLQINNKIEQLKRKITEPDLSHHAIHSLRSQISSLERDLIQKIAPNGEFIDFVSIDWEKIQSALNPSEIAIEFFSYETQETVQYAAVILSNNSAPFVFPLFCENELDKFIEGGESLYNYDNPDLYRVIWSVLETFSIVRNARKIYFSADKILNTIAIENLIDQDGYRANDKRNLCRLTSTRELVIKKSSEIANASAILYGGLNYDACFSDSLSKESIVSSGKFVQHNVARSSRGTYGYLSGTLEEIKYISEILKVSKIELRTGEKGSEDSFIAMNGKSPSIIHLATHGFFYEPDDIEDKLSGDPAKYAFLNIKNIKDISIETQAMRGSGILFSGANFTLKGQQIPNSLQDGILTAEEISVLNLQHTELAVLSACETGLGATTEEGVFGLQRGFKLAGVKCLLMSLWKVNDKITSKLMQYFYDNIAKGLSKTQALKEAQKKVRNNPETSRPYFWAGWILLDGLN